MCVQLCADDLDCAAFRTCVSESREVADVAQKADYEGRWAALEAFRKCFMDERAKELGLDCLWLI